MSEAKTHKGGCHCGKVSYEATTDLDTVIACNCSICRQRGLVLTFVPASSFTLLSGEGDVTDYQFAKKAIHHLFCRNCGVESYATGTAPDGSEMVAVNVRCLEGVDLDALNITPFDGASA